MNSGHMPSTGWMSILESVKPAVNSAMSHGEFSEGEHEGNTHFSAITRFGLR